MLTQSIYTSVSNADITPCKKVPKISSQPIPLIKDNFLGEFRTAIEKAKVRANLGIGDSSTLSWGNISGRLEDNPQLIEFIQKQWEYSNNEIDVEINNVKEALDYTLHYVSTFESNDEAVTEIKDYISDLKTNVLPKLEQDITDGDKAITESINPTLNTLKSNIDTINSEITKINKALSEIDIDKWLTDRASDTIEYKDTLNVKVSAKEGNGLSIVDDGLFVQESEKIDQLKEDVQELSENIVYKASLPDGTTSPSIGDVTVGDLDGKTLSQVIDTLFFPATTRDLVYPSIEFGVYDTLVEVNSIITKPTVSFAKGDAGETVSQTVELSYNGSPVTMAIFADLGTYTWTATYSYEAGEYLKDNRGEVTNKRIEKGEQQSTLTVNTTYPWYAGSVKQELVPYNTVTEYITITLGSVATIELPGENSQIQSFEVNSGLGFQAVNLDDWTESTETKNGITYKVWTKNSEYYSDLEHRIKFKLA